MTTITIRGRLAFGNGIWATSSINNGPEKYRARIMVDPADKATVKLIRDTRLEVARAKWGKKAEGILAANVGDKHKESWFESDYRNTEGDVADGFEGMFHMSTLSDTQPMIVDRDRTELTKRDGRPYSGCYCIFKVDIWAQDNTSGKGVRAQLAGVQFWKDGDSFGGGVRSKADDFEDLSDLGEDDEPPAPAARAAAAPAKGKANALVADDEDIA